MIELSSVTHIYKPFFGQTVQALDDMTLQVSDGEILGIAGPNGAGKSTLIALLLGYLEPTSGKVTIDGEHPRAYVERHGIGYLSELVAIPPRWTLEGALHRYAVLSGIPAADVEPRVNAAIERVGVGEHRKKRVKALSKGNLQRLGLAQALLRDERVLILDEPTHGLDPVWTANFRDLVTSLRRSDRAILIASHNLDELERVADRVAIIDHGKLQRLVSTRTMESDASATAYRVRVATGGEQVAPVFGAATARSDGSFEVTVADVADLNRRLAELIGRGALVTSVTPSHSALESQFREAVGEVVR